MLGVVHVSGAVVVFIVVVVVFVAVRVVGCSLRSVSALAVVVVVAPVVVASVVVVLSVAFATVLLVAVVLMVRLWLYCWCCFWLASLQGGGDCRCGDSVSLSFALGACAVLPFAYLFLGLSYHLLVLHTLLSLCFAFRVVLQK